MDPTLRLRNILAFWLPLVAPWLMMGAEGPYLSAIVARLDRPVENLAAFGLSSSLGWLVESPIIMLLSASTAVSLDRASFLALRRFAFLLNGALTALLALQTSPEGGCYLWLPTSGPLDEADRYRREKWLAQQLGADPASISGEHLGRLAGFRNWKRGECWVNALSLARSAVEA